MRALSINGLAALALLLFSLAPIGASAADSGIQIANRTNTLVMGRVSADTVKSLKRIDPMAEYLAKRLGHLGYAASDSLVVRSNQEMTQLLRSGDVDVVSETALSALLFAEAADAQPLMREWKKGVAQYHTVMIARPESGITRLENLRDKVVAFEDAGSTSGFLYPLAAMREAGLEPVPVRRGQRPPPGKVGYVFTDGEVNVAAWVARGLADAGAISNLDWEDIGRTPNNFKADLSVFYEGSPIIRSVFLVRGDLDPMVKAALKQILSTMHEDAEGREVLKAYYRVKRYDEISGPVAQDLERLRTMYEFIKDTM